MTALESFKRWCEAMDKKSWKYYSWQEWAGLHVDEFSDREIQKVREEIGV